MKNTILIPVVFLANLLLWSVMSVFLLMLGTSSSVSALVYREYSPLLSLLYPSFLQSLVYGSLCAIPATFFYMMRHSTVFPVSLLLVALCSALCLFFLFPYSFSRYERLSVEDAPAFDSPDFLTVYASGLIRGGSGSFRAVWFNQDESSGLPVVVVSANSSAPRGTPALKTHDALEFNFASGNLYSPTDHESDFSSLENPVIERTRDVPGYLLQFGSDMSAVYSSLATAWMQGFSQYITTAGPLVLSIFSLVSLCFLSLWRLLNLLLCLAAWRGVFFVWSYVESASFLQPLRTWTVDCFGSDKTSAVVFVAISVVFAGIGIARMIDRLLIHPEPAYE